MQAGSRLVCFRNRRVEFTVQDRFYIRQALTSAGLLEVQAAPIHGDIRMRDLPKLYSFTKTLRFWFLNVFTFLRTPLLAPLSGLLGCGPPVNRWGRGEKRPLKQLQFFLSVFSIQIHALDMIPKSINPLEKTEPSGNIGQSSK